MTKNKKTILIIVHMVLVLILAIFIFRCVLTGESYRKELSHSYARSLGDLTEYLSDMENTLSKAKYVSTATGQAGVAAALEGAGGGAKAAMSYLPFSAENSAQIEKSISVLSDFALFVGRKSAEGEALSPEDYEAFETLSEHVKKMGEALSDIREKTASGKISLGDTQRVLAKTLNFPAATPFDDGISRVAKELSALPTLLYDGPFSDHIEKREAEFLKGKPELSPEEAKKKAAAFLEVEESALTLNGETQGSLAAYEFSGEEQTIKITKKGGEVSFYKKNLMVPESKLSYEEALEKAKAILEKSGFHHMRESYYVQNDNTCTINFAGVQEDVILYPDLIKLTIELNEGGMVEFTSTGYLMNHRERRELVPEIDENMASSGLSGRLTVKGIATAIIPTPGEGERLCYEFTCTGEENQEIMVYINGKTGMEEQIYLVTHHPGGQLVS